MGSKFSGRKVYFSPRERTIGMRWSLLKKGAKKHGHELSLTKNEMENLIFSPCYYCGFIPKGINNSILRCKNLVLNCNGIDRVDSSKGYTLENCVPCCWNCNNNKTGASIFIMIKALQFLGYKVEK